MHELPWIVTKSRVKIIGKSHHEWPKIAIHGNKYFILFLTRYCMSWTQFRSKQSSIVHFAIVTKDGLFWLSIVTSPQLICEVTQTRGNSIVTSYSSIPLARANWHKGDLHWWITTVNIDSSSPGIHGLACKKSRILGLQQDFWSCDDLC